MANGQQKAQQNLDAFMQWQATQSNDDFKQITLKGQLNRTEIAKAVGCGKSGRCSLYVLVTVFTPPNNHDFASSLCCSRTRNHAK